LESRSDFVTIFHEDNRQLWFDSFEAAYCQLTSQPWHAEGGEL
jgi:hypothetical protein